MPDSNVSEAGLGDTFGSVGGGGMGGVSNGAGAGASSGGTGFKCSRGVVSRLRAILSLEWQGW